MKTIFLLLIYALAFVKSNAQTFSGLIDSIVTVEKKQGVREIIVSAQFGGWFKVGEKSFFFIKDSLGKCKVRSVLFVNKKNKIQIVEDTIIYNDAITEIFNIKHEFHDSILYQIKNINRLLYSYYNNNGNIVQIEFSDGKRRYLGVLEHNNLVISNTLLVSLNESFNKARYYWILNSAINNYIVDYLFWFPTTKKKKRCRTATR